MTLEEKVNWLEQIFSNDPEVRGSAMKQDLPQPVFDSNEELDKALEEPARRRK